MSLSLSLSLGIKSYSRGDSVPRSGETTVIALIGDSNTATSDMPAPATDSTVKAWKDSTAELVIADDNDMEFLSWGDKTSPLVFMGKEISQNTGNNVTVVPCGQGGSGFATDVWEAGGSLYTETVQRINDAVTASTNVTGIVFVISIGANNVGTPTYDSDLQSLITRLRTDITSATSTTPALLINVNKDWVFSNGREGIEAIGGDVGNRVAYTHAIDMTGVRSNDGVLSNGDSTHHYDMDIIAERLVTGIHTAKANTSAIGTQIVPQFYLSPTVVDNGDGTINIRVPYSAWYDPQPTSQNIDVYKADDDLGTNEELVQENSVAVGTTSVTYTLPASDGKKYYGYFKGTNSNGSKQFKTSNTYSN